MACIMNCAFEKIAPTGVSYASVGYKKINNTMSQR